MTDSFPRQQARTRQLHASARPRSFKISPDGGTVRSCASQRRHRPGDLPVGAGRGRRAASGWSPTRPSSPAPVRERRPPREKARRERVSASTAGGHRRLRHRRAVQPWPRSRWPAGLPGRPRPTARAAPSGSCATPRRRRSIPRPDPAGRRVAYVSARRAAGAPTSATGADRALAGPGRRTGGVSLRPGRVRRGRGDGPDPRLLVGAGRLGPAGRPGRRDARCSAGTSPTRPTRTPGQPRSRYPAAGHAERRGLAAVIAGLDGRLTPVDWDRRAFPYLVTASWDGGAARPAAAWCRAGTSGAAAAGGRPGDRRDHACCAPTPTRLGGHRARGAGLDRRRPDRLDRRRRRHAAAAGRPPPAELAAGTAEPVTPAGPAGPRGPGVDGDTVLFTASGGPDRDRPVAATARTG